jgi:hypothetical protein
MQLPYIGTLIADVREDTQNVESVAINDIRGISDRVFLRQFRYALDSIERKITSLYPFISQVTEEINVVANQTLYTLSRPIYLNLRITTVEYSHDGTPERYVPLYTSNSLDPDKRGDYPVSWSRIVGDNFGLRLHPTPAVTRGRIRVVYQQSLDTPDLRRGRITAIGTAALNTTTLTIDPTSILAADATDLTARQKFTRICVSNIDGTVTAYNLAYTAFAANVITLTPVLTSTIPTLAIGQFITFGEWTTTHPKLPRSVESYLMEYVGRRIKKKESSPEDWQAIDIECERIAKEIVQAYKMADSTTVKPIPLAEGVFDMINTGRGGFNGY